MRPVTGHLHPACGREWKTDVGGYGNLPRAAAGAPGASLAGGAVAAGAD